MGPNGAGETTFFNLISGCFFPPIPGTIEGGYPIGGGKRVGLGMARTFHPEIFPELSVFENVRIGAEVAGGSACGRGSATEKASIRNESKGKTLLAGLRSKLDRLVGGACPRRSAVSGDAPWR